MIQVFEADVLVIVNLRHLCSVSAQPWNRYVKAEQTYNLECIPLYVAIVLMSDDRQRRKFMTMLPSENFLTMAQVTNLGLILV